jgi:hypothetical protein
VIPRVEALRYVTPLREGGSLPGIVEADDLGTYVVKFRGAGQGPKVLVAEVVVGGLARRLGLPVPELVAVQLDPPIARYEADQEVQELLNASLGLNLGVDFLPGAFGYDAACEVSPETASSILWLDAFTANVDRSWRNPNLLVWHHELWCIDHGAALYFHHAWSRGRGSPERFARQPYDVRDHVLSDFVDSVAGVAPGLARQVDRDLLVDVLEDVPDAWLEPAPGAAEPPQLRSAYVDHLVARLQAVDVWLPRREAA